MSLTASSGEVICLFDELHKEAQNRLRRMGRRGKVLSLTTIAEHTHLDYKTFFPMQNKTLKQYDAEVVKRLCLYFGIEISQFFYRETAGVYRPPIGDLALSQEALPTDTGFIESLIQDRIDDWQHRTASPSAPTFKQLGDLVGLHAQTVSAWVNNTVSIYTLTVLEKWCAFFQSDIGGILRYYPPTDLSLTRILLPTFSTEAERSPD